MGIKGDKLTGRASLNAELIVSKLESIGNINSKKMFGGYGIFCNGKMFGLINSKGEVYFKANESNLAMFEKEGSVKHSKMPYYSLPLKVLENFDHLIIWAKSSIAINK